MSAILSVNEHEEKAHRPLNAVVLDDDRFDRKRLSRWVRTLGPTRLRLTEASDLSQLRQLMSNRSFDLVFLDYWLADGNGVDAMKHVATSGENASSFVVMISGTDDATARTASFKSGCDLFVEKSRLNQRTLQGILGAARASARISRATMPDGSALGYWSARARRRKITDRTTVHSPVSGESTRHTTGHDGQTASLPKGLSSAPRPNGFMREFFDNDEFEFNFPKAQ